MFFLWNLREVLTPNSLHKFVTTDHLFGTLVPPELTGPPSFIKIQAQFIFPANPAQQAME